MPIAILILVRIYRALKATFRLLLDVKVLRALPWTYIRRLPLRSPWIGIVTLTLAISLPCALVGLAVPGDTGAALAELAWLTALGGLVSTWVRALTQWRRLRR